MKKIPSLASQYYRWLSTVFISFTLLISALFISFLVMPMAQRAATDLAGLIVLSAQTWSELPPEARPAFQNELHINHELELHPAKRYSATDDLHPPFIYLVEQALAAKIPNASHLLKERRGDEVWYWVNVPTGSDVIAIAFPQDRYDSQPLEILAAGLLMGIFVSWALARWLSKRIAEPIEKLSNAISKVGQGDSVSVIQVFGPKEIAALIQHFNLMTQQVQDLIAARTHLLAGISHDLRTPLTRMLLSLELMRIKPDASLIERVEKDVHHMNQLISQVLDLSRGLGQEPAQHLNAQQFMQGLADEYTPKTQHISLHVQDGVLHAPPIALGRAITNLLENALRYAPGKPIELHLEMDSSKVRIGVLDNGPGVPESQLSLILEPFQRLETSRSPLTGGSGLGLSIVSELCKANTWAFEVSNRPNGGLQAWITLAA